MELIGQSLIGAHRGSQQGKAFQAMNPQTGAALPPVVFDRDDKGVGRREAGDRRIDGQHPYLHLHRTDRGDVPERFLRDPGDSDGLDHAEHDRRHRRFHHRSCG